MHSKNNSSMEIRFLKKIKGITRKDKVKSLEVRSELKIKPIETVIEAAKKARTHTQTE